MPTLTKTTKGLGSKPNIPSRLLVKLDHRTTILLKKQSLFKIWKQKYPEAKIIQYYQTTN